jgi:hypothetical protein
MYRIHKDGRDLSVPLDMVEKFLSVGSEKLQCLLVDIVVLKFCHTNLPQGFGVLKSFKKSLKSKAEIRVFIKALIDQQLNSSHYEEWKDICGWGWLIE